MQLIKESVIINSVQSFFLLLYHLWCESVLCSFCSAFARVCSHLWRGSFICRAISRTSILSHDWKTSRIVLLCTHVINVIPTCLHTLHRKFTDVWESSAIMRTLYWLGENVHVLLSWLLLALLIIPQDFWNNMYSLAAVLVILLLFWFGGMRHKSLRLDLPCHICLHSSFFHVVFKRPFLQLAIFHVPFHLHGCGNTACLLNQQFRQAKKNSFICAFRFVNCISLCVYSTRFRPRG